jgi:hypothetical protein
LNNNALDTAWTRMTPAVALATGDSFDLADRDLGRQRVSQQLRRLRGFVV